MIGPSENLVQKLSKLKIEASKKKVEAARYELKCRKLEEKAVKCSTAMMKHREKLDAVLKRKAHFESKAGELESAPPKGRDPESVRLEIEQRRRKASELLEGSKEFEAKMVEEKARMDELLKSAEELRKKAEASMGESKRLEMEAVATEIRLGIRK